MHKRVSLPSSRVLQSTFDKLEAELDGVLEFDISENEGNLELIRTTAFTCKKLFLDLSDVTFKLIDYETNNGSVQNACTLRSKRQNIKKEVHSFIKIINALLDNSGISFSLTSDSVNDIPNSGAVVESASTHFHPLNTSSPINTPFFTTPLQNPGENSRVQLGTGIELNDSITGEITPNHDKNYLRSVDASRLPQSSMVGSLPPKISESMPCEQSYPYERLNDDALASSVHNTVADLRVDAKHAPRIVSRADAGLSSIPEFEPVISHVSTANPTNSVHFNTGTNPIAPTVTRAAASAPGVSTGAAVNRFPISGTFKPQDIIPGFASLSTTDYQRQFHDNGFHTNPLNPIRGLGPAPMFSAAPRVQLSGPYHVPRSGAPALFPSQRPLPHAVSQSTVGSDMVSDALTQHIVRNQLYQKCGEPFDGEPHKYYAWVNIMQRKMANLNLDPWDVLSILYENTTGKPKKLLENFLYVGASNPQQTLEEAWIALYEHFGTGSRIAFSITEKLESFAPIKFSHQHDRLGDLLNICRIIEVNLPVAAELQMFNLTAGMRQIWLKLPDHLQNGWRTASADFKMANFGNSPSLVHLIAYLRRKYNELSDPSLEKPTASNTTTSRLTARTKQYNYSNPSTVFATSAENTVSQKLDVCPLHPDGKHAFESCNTFKKKPHSEKVDIIKENRRCFSCLGPHFKKDCKTEISCEICKKKHATSMHDDSYGTKREFTVKKDHKVSYVDANSRSNSTPSNLCTAICGGESGKSCSKVLLVDLSLPSKSNKILRCYAILDEQSSSTFVDTKVATFFNLNLPMRSYTIRTMSGLKTSTAGMEIRGLKVKGVNQKKLISLPNFMTNDHFPDARCEIATPAIVSEQTHIRHLSKHFLPYDPKAEVLMLIGRDCGSAMSTQCLGYRAPFAHRTPLGWALVGSVCKETSNKTEKSVFRVQLQNTTEHWSMSSPFEKGESSFLGMTNVFFEAPDDEFAGKSQDDLKFIHEVYKNIRVNEEHSLTMPLPFKNDKVPLPDNRTAVYCRMTNTLAKIKRDPEKLAQCLKSMANNIKCNHIEEVPASELKGTPGKVWYLPVFTVTHAKKKKIRIVWDSKASYKEVSLNSQLSTGPYVNTKLSTVLMRFRKNEVAFTGDIESMFYAFHLEPHDRDFTRFFWWKSNDPTQQLVEYRARKHIFGNTSSPALANLGLRFAVLNSEHATEDAKRFVFDNFYVDDGCGSAHTVEEAIRILKETRNSLFSFNIRLHKLASNRPEVLSAFPKSEIGETSAQEFNHSQTHRTLGVEWNPLSDRFVVRADVPHKPFTKRGTLATTNSFFDPLGFAAPIILKGRLATPALPHSS